MKSSIAAAIFTVGLLAMLPTQTLAHCDSMNGPVIKAAQKALETGNVNLVLLWIQKKDEPEIMKAFQRTLAVRKLSQTAREMADMYFFETLVRVHRAGEGEPYTGLKPVGSEVEPGIEMADEAVDAGSARELIEHLNGTMEHTLHTLFTAVKDRKAYNPDNTDAGREYVAAYVTFIHYVEQLQKAAQGPGAGHADTQLQGAVHPH